MALYSDGYAYHGVTKESLRQIRQGLLVRYDRVSSTHIFSGVKVAKEADQLTGEVGMIIDVAQHGIDFIISEFRHAPWAHGLPLSGMLLILVATLRLWSSGR